MNSPLIAIYRCAEFLLRRKDIKTGFYEKNAIPIQTITNALSWTFYPIFELDRPWTCTIYLKLHFWLSTQSSNFTTENSFFSPVSTTNPSNGRTATNFFNSNTFLNINAKQQKSRRRSEEEMCEKRNFSSSIAVFTFFLRILSSFVLIHKQQNHHR